MKISERGRFQEGLWNIYLFIMLDNMEEAQENPEVLDSLGLGPGLHENREGELRAGLHSSILFLLLISYI